MTTTIPEVLTGAFTVAGGLFISWMGEDGDVIILGHHDDAAVEAALKVLDPDLAGCPYRAGWAVLTDPPAHDCVADDTTSCHGCDEITNVPWWMQWDVAQDTQGAFPVMVVEA